MLVDVNRFIEYHEVYGKILRKWKSIEMCQRKTDTYLFWEDSEVPVEWFNIGQDKMFSGCIVPRWWGF